MNRGQNWSELSQASSQAKPNKAEWLTEPEPGQAKPSRVLRRAPTLTILDQVPEPIHYQTKPEKSSPEL